MTREITSPQKAELAQIVGELAGYFRRFARSME